LKSKYYNFTKKDSKNADLYIYGEITPYKWDDTDVTASGFKDDLESMGNIEVLNIYINSPGGSVFEGQSIYSQLKRHKAIKNVYIDGISASIASVISMCGNVYMPKNAMIMVHNASAFAEGNSEDFRALADTLDKVNQTIVEVYIEKTGLPEDKIKELMDKESWLTGKEAVDLGFADVLIEENKVSACCKKHDMQILNKYKNTPKFLIVENDNIEKEQFSNSKITEDKDKLKEEEKLKDKLKQAEEIKVMKAKLALECEL
jgi:ATP-dependent Clp protease protease subunit